jgi:hypothetical protein
MIDTGRSEDNWELASGVAAGAAFNVSDRDNVLDVHVQLSSHEMETRALNATRHA